MNITSSRRKNFQKKVMNYYKKNGRSLPWRTTKDPYKILISEIMLQQTQVDRVVEYFNTWTKIWPKISDLAAANRNQVLMQWMGLGYNNRAVNLHKAAKIINKKYNGNVIKAMENYHEISGIGPYTAAAVQIFARNKDIVTVDTNIRRIFIKEFRLKETMSDKELWDIAEQCLPKGQSRDWHNALMDYGATHLTSRRTGIRPKTRQSTFEGSDRQMRARILRLLLSGKCKTFSQLKRELDIPGSRLNKILKTMIKDDLVKGEREYKLSQ